MLYFSKEAMPHLAHARANENKLKTSARFFQVLSEILEGCLYLFKSQSSFDS